MAFVCVVISATVVRADLTDAILRFEAPVEDRAAALLSHPVGLPAIGVNSLSVPVSDAAGCVDVGLDRFAMTAGPGHPCGTVSQSTADDVLPTIHELPGSPDSAALFLSALLSIGAWHLARSMTQMQFGQLPEWYHPYAPAQIGHAVAFDLEFAPCILNVFDEPGVAPQLIRHTPQRDGTLRCDPQFILSLADPRGPPASL